MKLSKKFIDDFIIIPGGIGSFDTGLLYSIFTNWGWFKHRWITTKWAITLFGIIFGTFWLGPWLNAMPPISLQKGLGALSDTTYMHSQQMLLVWVPLTLVLILFALFISVLKPWKKKKGVKLCNTVSARILSCDLINCIHIRTGHNLSLRKRQ